MSTKNWTSIFKIQPKHKDLVLCHDGNMTLPAIFYDNDDFTGFYHFTTAYHNTTSKVYSKVRLKDSHRILGVTKWKHMDEPE